MSEIARNYIATKKARKAAEESFEAALVKQYGWRHYAATDYNGETQAAFEVMNKAIDAAHRARGIANDNGGDFALPVGEEQNG